MKYHDLGYGLEFVIDSQFAGKTVADFLQHFLISSKKQYILLRDEKLLLNGKAVTSKQTLLADKDRLTVVNDSDQLSEASETACKVIYRNDAIYIAHKEKGIIIHSDDPEEETLARQAARWQLEAGISSPVRYLHRLDKDTSGLVMFCHQPFLQPLYDHMMEEKKIHRQYLAITTGKGSVGRKYTFNQPIGRDRHTNGKYRVSSSGKEALTKAEIIASNGRYLYWKCLLETGRTHQIRVHLSHNGFPIINDPLYGVKDQSIPGMALWACRIQYIDPVSNELVTVTDDYDPAFEYLKKKGFEL